SSPHSFPTRRSSDLDDRDEHVGADRDPDLSLHGVLGGAVERFDPKVLFDPLEEDLYLPAAPVQLGDRVSTEVEVVRQQRDGLATLEVANPHPAQGLGIFLRGQRSLKDDGLIADQAGRPIYPPRVSAAEIQPAL